MGDARRVPAHCFVRECRKGLQNNRVPSTRIMWRGEELCGKSTNEHMHHVETRRDSDVTASRSRDDCLRGRRQLRTSVTKELMSQKNPCVTGRLRRTCDVIYGVDSNGSGKNPAREPRASKCGERKPPSSHGFNHLRLLAHGGQGKLDHRVHRQKARSPMVRSWKRSRSAVPIRMTN